MDNDAIAFHARFGGVSREIYVPVHNVLAIYANENGQGMAFEVTGNAPEASTQAVPETAVSTAPALSSVPSSAPDSVSTDAVSVPDDNSEPPKKGGRPTLTRIK